MGVKQLATKIDERVKNALDRFCKAKGYKLNHFIENAILDKLEEYEDISDLRKLRAESFRSFNEVVLKLKSNGQL